MDQEERRRRIGATDAPKILGLSPWGGPHDVWLEKTGRLEPWQGNKATETGKRLEPAILDEAEEQLGQLDRDVLLYLDGGPMSATLDAITKTGEVVEAKTSGIVSPLSGDWGEPGTDEVPTNYLVQTQIQMLVSGSELCHLFALLGGRGIVRYLIQRDDEFCQEARQRCEEWWERHIVKGIEPELTVVPSVELCKRIRRDPGSVTTLGYAADVLRGDLEVAKAVAKDAENRVNELQARLILELGANEVGVTPDGYTISLKKQTRKAYQVEESTFPVFRVSKPKVKK